MCGVTTMYTVSSLHRVTQCTVRQLSHIRPSSLSEKNTAILPTFEAMAPIKVRRGCLPPVDISPGLDSVWKLSPLLISPGLRDESLRPLQDRHHGGGVPGPGL